MAMPLYNILIPTLIYNISIIFIYPYSLLFYREKTFNYGSYRPNCLGISLQGLTLLYIEYRSNCLDILL
jgi:hypothetical protein